MAGLDVNARLRLDSSDFDEKMRRSQERADATARAAAKAARDAAAAQQFAAKFAGDAVQQQALKIVSSRKLEADAAADLARANKLVRNGLLEGEQGANAQAAALQRLTLAKKATADASKVQEHAEVSQRMAASAAVRGLESGNVGIRSVENFLTTIPGVGIALQAIFPVLGAVAFAAAVAKGVMELVDMREKGKQAGQAMADAFSQLQFKLQESNDTLELQNAKLAQVVAKLEHKPGDGLRTALAEAAVAADRLQSSLSGALKDLNNLLKEQSVGRFEGLLSGVANTVGVLKEVKDYTADYERRAQAERAAYRKAMQEAGSDQKKQEAATSAHYGKMDAMAADAARHFRGRATDVARQQKAADDAAAQAKQGNPFGRGPTPIDLTPIRTGLEDAAVVFDRVQDNTGEESERVRSEKQQVKLEAGKDAKGAASSAAEEARKADEARLKAITAHVAEWKTLAPVSAKAIYDFYDAQRATFRAGSDAYNTLMERQAALAEEGARKVALSITSYKSEQKRMAEEASALNLKNPMVAWAQDLQRAAAARQDAANEMLAQQAHNRARMEEMQVQDAAGSSMTKAAAAAEIAAIHTREYGAELDRLQAKLKEVQGAQYLNGHEAEREQQAGELQKRIRDVQANRRVQIFEDQARTSAPDSSASVGARDALNELADSARDNARALHDLATGGIRALNAAIVNGGGFKQAGAGILREVETASLQKAEGMLLKVLGFGSKDAPKGTASDPIFVQMAQASGGAGGVASAVSALAGGGSDGGAGGLMKFALGFAGIPGFADGVSNFSGGMALVGERGPELLNLPRGSNVVPNHRLQDFVTGGGGGDTHHWNIDARGATDPALVHAAAKAGAEQAVAGMAQVMGQKHRLPPSKRY